MINKIIEKIQCIQEDEDILDYTDMGYNLIQILKLKGRYEKIKKDFYFSYAKTIYENKESALFVFSITLPVTLNGISSQSSEIMKYITYLEKILVPIDYMNLSKEIENKTIVVYIKIIKKIEKS